MGCGHGCDVEYFTKQKSKVVGLDISKELLALAKKRVPEANLVEGSFESLDFPDKTFDLIYSRYALQHSKSLEETFSEAARVLKSKGDFLFLVTHPLRQFIEKKGENYWVKELIESEILDKTVRVKEYSYTFEEYCSPKILKNFTLEQCTEEFDRESAQIKGIYPGYLIMHYKKR